MSCPMGSECFGCEYAKNCARPRVQARKLRDAVERLNLEYGAERKSGLAMLDRLIAANAEVERLRTEVELDAMRVGSLTAEVEAQRQQISALVAEVERLKRERDALDAKRHEEMAAAVARYEERLAAAEPKEVTRLRSAYAVAQKELRDARRAAMEEGFAEGMEHAAYFIEEFTLLIDCPKCGELVQDAPRSIAFMIREESKRYSEFQKSQAKAAAIRAAAKEER